MKTFFSALLYSVFCFFFAAAAWATPLSYATYRFGNTLTALEGGVPALTAVDPEAANTFTTATVFGNSRTVYQWSAANLSPADEAGLSFPAGGLADLTSYSVQMIFSFSQRDTLYRRILDVQNRQSDGGFYVAGASHPNNLELAGSGAPIADGSHTFSLNTFYDVVLVNSGGTVSVYFNGALDFSVVSTEMNANNVNNPGKLINLFLDNNVGSGQEEYSNGQIALFRVWNGALSGTDVTALDANPFGAAVPEPSAWLMAAFGLGLLLVFKVRREARMRD
jgi:hypothetical protein